MQHCCTVKDDTLLHNVTVSVTQSIVWNSRGITQKKMACYSHQLNIKLTLPNKLQLQFNPFVDSKQFPCMFISVL